MQLPEPSWHAVNHRNFVTLFCYRIYRFYVALSQRCVLYSISCRYSQPLLKQSHVGSEALTVYFSSSKLIVNHTRYILTRRGLWGTTTEVESYVSQVRTPLSASIFMTIYYKFNSRNMVYVPPYHTISITQHVIFISIIYNFSKNVAWAASSDTPSLPELQAVAGMLKGDHFIISSFRSKYLDWKSEPRPWVPFTSQLNCIRVGRAWQRRTRHRRGWKLCRVFHFLLSDSDWAGLSSCSGPMQGIDI